MLRTLAAAAAVSMIAAAPANAALTIVFEALSTPNGVTGSFTATVPYLPIWSGGIPEAWFTDCTFVGGCGVITLINFAHNGVDTSTDIADVFSVGASSVPGTGGAAFRFANNAFTTVGVHDTLPDWINVGRITVSGTVDGPPRDYNPTEPEPCDPVVENCPMPGGVPEPTTWALMILGFGTMGAALRQRRYVLP
ncbi:MAG: hypothetical protein DI570_09225 [Phenylobacterium zucineum]|nr:MAG: hypothetical protein DI570_09225 [Phenylobacterium zucineum]